MNLIEDIFWLKRYSGAKTGAKIVRLNLLSIVKALKHTENFLTSKTNATTKYVPCWPLGNQLNAIYWLSEAL